MRSRLATSDGVSSRPFVVLRKRSFGIALLSALLKTSCSFARAALIAVVTVIPILASILSFVSAFAVRKMLHSWRTDQFVDHLCSEWP